MSAEHYDESDFEQEISDESDDEYLPRTMITRRKSRNNDVESENDESDVESEITESDEESEGEQQISDDQDVASGKCLSYLLKYYKCLFFFFV